MIYDKIVKTPIDYEISDDDINMMKEEFEERLKEIEKELKEKEAEYPPIKIPLYSFTAPKNKNIALTTEVVIPGYDVRNTPSADLDRMVKEKLARQLAEMMIEEDLISIRHDHDIVTDEQRFLARVNFTQE